MHADEPAEAEAPSREITSPEVPEEEARGGPQHTPTSRANERPPPNGLNHNETVVR